MSGLPEKKSDFSFSFFLLYPVRGLFLGSLRPGTKWVSSDHLVHCPDDRRSRTGPDRVDFGNNQTDLAISVVARFWSEVCSCHYISC